MSSIRRATVTLIAVSTLMLSACGSSADPTGSPSAGSGDRVVTDSVGEVTIPESAERVVTLHHIATQPLTDLGLVPVGRGMVKENEVTPETWSKLENVPVVSDGAQPNFEEIAALEPDLIIGHNKFQEATLESLRVIAPVLVVDIEGSGRTDWQGRVHLVAQALGKEDMYDDLVAKFDERAADIADEHSAVLGRERFSLVASWAPGTITVFGSQSQSGRVFAKAGATISPNAEAAAAADPEQEVEVSAERTVELLDGSAVLYSTNMRGEPALGLVDVMNEPVFRAVPAVQQGNDFPAGKGTIAGFEDANYNLDLFETALTGLEDA